MHSIVHCRKKACVECRRVVKKEPMIREVIQGYGSAGSFEVYRCFDHFTVEHLAKIVIEIEG
jgi:hypothetical protein